MARIIENLNGRRSIKMSVEDIICVVREYQNTTGRAKRFDSVRNLLSDICIYLPEEVS